MEVYCMNTFNSERFNKIIRITEVFIKVFKILFMVLGILTMVALAVFSLIPSESLVFSSEGLRISFVFIPVEIHADELVFYGSLKPLFMSGFFIVTIYLAFAYAMVDLIGRVVAKTKDKTPFDAIAIKSLFRLAYVLMISGIILPIFDFIVLSMINNAYTELNLHIEFSFQLGFVFTGVLIYILANIFEYGAYLQSEVDATV